MLNNSFMYKDPHMVPEQAPLIILDSKSAVFMYKNGKDTKHTRHISMRMHLLRNSKKWNIHKTLWCEVVMNLKYIGTNTVTEDEFNSILGFTMVIIDNWHNTFTRGVIEYRRFWKTRCSDYSNILNWYRLYSIGFKCWIQHLKLF